MSPSKSGYLKGVKSTQLMQIFTFKKVWNFFIKIQLTKSDPKRTRREKYLPSCQLGLIEKLMPPVRLELTAFRL
jgi:hypothetical protein